MNPDVMDSWGPLSDEWQSPATTLTLDPPTIRARTQTRTRWLRALVAAEVLVTLGMLALIAGVLQQRRDGATLLWAIAVIIALVVTWTFSVRNRRGLWRAAGERAVDFVRLTRARAQASLRTVRFTRWFLVVVWSVYGTLFLKRYFARPFSPSERLLWGVVATYTAAILVWSEWYRRRALREVAAMNELSRALGGES